MHPPRATTVIKVAASVHVPTERAARVYVVNGEELPVIGLSPGLGDHSTAAVLRYLLSVGVTGRMEVYQDGEEYPFISGELGMWADAMPRLEAGGSGRPTSSAPDRHGYFASPL